MAIGNMPFIPLKIRPGTNVMGPMIVSMERVEVEVEAVKVSHSWKACDDLLQSAGNVIDWEVW